MAKTYMKLDGDLVEAGVGVNLPSPKEEQTKTVTEPNFSSGNVVITPDAGKVLTQVTVVKDNDLVPENIVKDVDIFGVVGTAETGGGSLTYKSLSFNDIKVLSWRSYRNSLANRYYLKSGTRKVTKSAATLLYYGNPFTMQFQLLPSGTYDLVIPGLPQITASINYNAGVGWTETWTNTANYWGDYEKPAIQIVVDSTNHYLVADAVINKDTTTESSNFGNSGFQISSYYSNSDYTTINSIGDPNKSDLHSRLINSASNHSYPVNEDISLTRVHLIVLGGATTIMSDSTYVLSLSTWDPSESAFGQMWIVTPT